MDATEMLENATRIEEEAIRDRVVAGIKALEDAVAAGRLDAGWPDRIDPASLSMDSAYSCVVGQLHRETNPTDPYQAGLEIIDGDAERRPAAHGFDTDGTDTYYALNEAWLTALGWNE